MKKEEFINRLKDLNINTDRFKDLSLEECFKEFSKIKFKVKEK